MFRHCWGDINPHLWRWSLHLTSVTVWTITPIVGVRGSQRWPLWQVYQSVLRHIPTQSNTFNLINNISIHYTVLDRNFKTRSRVEIINKMELIHPSSLSWEYIQWFVECFLTNNSQPGWHIIFCLKSVFSSKTIWLLTSWAILDNFSADQQFVWLIE